MDLVTQGVLGAATAAAGADKKETRLAAGIGCIAGLVPDLDALIRSPDDPLLVLEYHRHFTHSLLFIPVIALAVAAIAWLATGRQKFNRLFRYAALGAGLAGLLDACTSYGTHLLWPFYDQRIAWNLIAIVDPVFSLLLLIPLVLSLVRNSPPLSRYGLGLAVIYLGLAAIQSQRATGAVEKVIAERGHRVERQLVKPTLANIILWRSVYQAGDRVYVDAVRVGFTGNTRIYSGDSVPLADLDHAPVSPPGSDIHTQLKRFTELSGGWVARDPGNPRRLGDIRYSMLPDSTVPLWGMETTGSGETAALDFYTDRDFSDAMRGRFLRMLQGR